MSPNEPEPKTAHDEQATKMQAEEKQKLLEASEVSLWLDTYDDIFSDFDPRPYSQRALSDDFLYEAKKVAKEKATGLLELKFLIPSAKRDEPHENIIKKRMRDYFKTSFKSAENEITTIKRKAVVSVLFGAGLMFTASIIPTLTSNYIVSHFLLVLLEPIGWFTVWVGLEQIFYTAKQKKPDLEFYKKMSNCRIEFISY